MRIPAFASIVTLLCTCMAPAAIAADPQPLAVCPDPASDTYYFPAGTFTEKFKDADQFHRDWYSKHLAAMNEPSLSCVSTKADETYRFLWLRSFHHPVAVRMERRGKVWSLHEVELDGAGGYAPGKLLHTTDRKLTTAAAAKLTATLDRVQFWSTSIDKPPKPCHAKEPGAICIEVGADGAEWIFEGRAATYHIVDRWDGGEEPIGELGFAMLDIAGVKVGKGEMY